MVMDIRKIKKLIELIQETGIGEIEVQSGEDSVRIRCQGDTPAPTQTVIAAPAAAPAPAAPTETTEQPTSTPAPSGYELKSPMVGTAYLAPAPGANPFVEVGQRVKVGDTLCLIEAMKMYNKIEADKAGVVSARLIDNQQPVEYEQTLFIIDTDNT